MKKKLTSKLMLKIVSVIVAFLFWLVIINITDPTTSKTFYDIPVQILNENVITSANQVYDIVDGDTVKVTVKGKRSFVETLKESDFTATADLSELSKVNAVSINVKLNKESTSSVDVDWNNAVLKVALEKRITKSFKVEVDYEGELSENYVLGEMTAKPNMIEVSCGESKFKKIDHVGVMVSLKGQSEDFDSEYSPVLYDANGDSSKARLQRIYATAFDSKDELNKYLEELEEAKNRDHNKLGREMELFTTGSCSRISRPMVP